MRLDLHVHTSASDGAWSPQQVVEGAAAGGLDVLAVADHDTTAAVAAALSAGRERDLQVVPAIELSSTHERREIHVLGYFVDPDAGALVDHRAVARRLRDERMREMVALLRAEGTDVTFADVEHTAGKERFSLGRPHLARTLVARGYARSVSDAFQRLIGDRCAAFVPTRLLQPSEAVELVLAAGGIPVWAHPPGDLLDALLPELVRAGLRGLEVFRPTHRRNDVLRLEQVCRTSGLLMSGGSDWHTPEAGTRLGDFHVTADEVEALLEEGGM